MRPTTNQDPQSILKALIQGVDPKTGGELAPDQIIHRIEVNRSMQAAVDALEQVKVRQLRRAQLPTGVGMPWTAEEEQQLATQFGHGEPIDRIADKHNRTVRAIEARLERLALITADQRTTNNSFTGLRAPKKGTPS